MRFTGTQLKYTIIKHLKEMFMNVSGFKPESYDVLSDQLAEYINKHVISIRPSYISIEFGMVFGGILERIYLNAIDKNIFAAENPNAGKILESPKSNWLLLLGPLVLESFDKNNDSKFANFPNLSLLKTSNIYEAYKMHKGQELYDLCKDDIKGSLVGFAVNIKIRTSPGHYEVIITDKDNQIGSKESARDKLYFALFHGLDEFEKVIKENNYSIIYVVNQILGLWPTLTVAKRSIAKAWLNNHVDDLP